MFSIKDIDIKVEYSDTGVYNNINISIRIPVLATEDSICESCMDKRKNAVVNIFLCDLIEEKLKKVLKEVINILNDEGIIEIVSELMKENGINDGSMTISDCHWLSALLYERLKDRS